jgi:hypothetical protein
MPDYKRLFLKKTANEKPIKSTRCEVMESRQLRIEASAVVMKSPGGLWLVTFFYGKSFLVEGNGGGGWYYP